MSKITGWTGTPAKYAAAVQQAETANGIPAGLLSRLLWQESRFKPDASNPSGALGIAQIMPATARDPGFGVTAIANRLDPLASIRFAGQYLKAMRNYTGSWRLALAAYNWGPGYVKKAPNGPWPEETRNYVAQITKDVTVA